MLNKQIIALIVLTVTLVLAVFAKPASILADEQTCVQVYGGGVVCGAEAPEHKPVEAGLAENLAIIGGGFLLASGVLLYYSRKVKTQEFIAQ